ncbi:hypothetical protein [Nakamurella alba]|uniref:hypothetical protein n=1 Tax=Nakamurella alba TaxID=2665158 RepID=UPI001E3FD01C|nr:hypothetical protein [Nakamurella alba]
MTGHEEVRAYWLRQWGEIDPVVTPVAVTTEPDGALAVQVRQLVRSHAGEMMSDDLLDHVYRFHDGLVREMTIRGK